MSAGQRREGESKAAYRLRIWHAMTPADRDYDRFVARSIPQGAHWSAETEGGRQMQAERDRLIDEATDNDGCSCHINPPCGFCMRQSDEEDAEA
ncbi:hypothetical protein [Sphingomonas sp. UBA978]|uniref:hypothetical protein n=1 Tax=Sphingomonas sp. UBA978 TaxID=1947536 RepID=UPI0025D1DD23|nr:hypothetical protein [Sphingomonas sp. UBA978]